MPSPRGLRLTMGALGVLPMLVPLANFLASVARGAPAPGLVLQPGSGLIVLVGLLCCAFWLGPFGWSGRLALASLDAAVTLAVVAQPIAPAGGFLLWAFPAVLLGFTLAPRFAFAALAFLVLLALGTLLARIGRAGDMAAALFAGTEMVGVVTIAGAAAVAVGELQRTNHELRLARAEIEQLAVEQERTRFARDLHDLLGHTLSLMLLKLQVARRLLPEGSRADRELADLQGLGRTALEDVREAVDSYRQPTLSSEIAGAQIAMEAAGIQFSAEDEAGPLPAAVEATLAWSLREAVTNVLRHSRARHCRARITAERRQVLLEVEDDGRGAPPHHVETGLRSLRERVVAAGGRLHIDPRGSPNGGLALRVQLPLERGGGRAG